jgi:hypothetical protein
MGLRDERSHADAELSPALRHVGRDGGPVWTLFEPTEK